MVYQDTAAEGHTLYMKIEIMFEDIKVLGRTGRAFSEQPFYKLTRFNYKTTYW